MSASATGSRNSSKSHRRSPPNKSGKTECPIDITKDEFERIKDALQKEEFRKLFFDYIEEIQDPENRKLFEQEIKQFEAERGVEVKFVNPEPGFVIKTSVDGTLKCFVNVAKCDVVGKPKSEVGTSPESGERGITWSIPLAQSPPRDDLDAHNKRCRVYDVIFHSDSLHLASRNKQFRKCLIDTALDAVEREFKVSLDRSNLKFPKLQFKGIARPTVIRSLAKDAPKEAKEPHPLDDVYPNKPTEEQSIPKVVPTKPLSKKPDFNTPKYVIKYRRGVDLTEFTEAVDAKLSMTVPQELVVEIELPMLKSTADCQLDVTDKRIYLLNERAGAKYRLNIELPYEVIDKEGHAHFDVDLRRLCITLPVKQMTLDKQREMRDTLLHLNREDSGVESDVREDGNSVRSSPIEELTDKFAVIEIDNKDDGIPESPSVTSVEPFLSANVHYELPQKFSCNVLDNIMVMVLDVRNVEPNSVQMVRDTKSVHLQFYSLGSGYFPFHYAFYMELPKETDREIVSAEAEAWENNVLLNLKLSGCSEGLQTYWAGVKPDDTKEYFVHEKLKASMSAGRPNRNNTPTPSISPELNVTVNRPDDESIEIKIRPRNDNGHSVNTTEEDDSIPQVDPKKMAKKPIKKKNKRRSYSESTCDDIKAMEEKRPASAPTTRKTVEQTDNLNIQFVKPSGAVAVPNSTQQRKQRSYSESRHSLKSNSSSTLPPSFKGILKHHSRYDKPHSSISDSCSSSIDDCSSIFSCSIDGASASSYRFSQSFSDIPEENRSDELSESCKKTVRFSDDIKKKVFRYDSSILGQKKKNQKRRELKQRALQRRLSEGDSADYEENKPVNFYNQKCIKGDDSNSDHHNIQNSSGEQRSHNNNSNNEKGKNIKSKVSRTRLESESSTDIDASKSSMMFEMDM